MFREKYNFTGPAWAIIREQPGLLRIPALAVACQLDAGGLIFGLFAPASEDGSLRPLVIAALIAAYPLTLVSVFFNVAFVAMLDARLRGEEWTVRDALRAARARWRSIAGWALIATTVGVLLSLLEHIRLGQALSTVVRWVLGIAWEVVTLLVVPVLAFEERGPFGSLRRSGSLFRLKWRQSLRNQFTLGVIGFLAGIPAMALVCAAMASWYGEHYGAAIVVGAAGALYLFAVMAIFSALWQTLAVGLYRHAVGLPLGPFDRISHAFPPRPQEAAAAS